MKRDVVLTEKQIWNYMLCPAHFEMAQRKIVPEESPTLSYYINIIAKQFFVNLMDGVILTPDKLKKKWDIICQKNLDFLVHKKCIAGYAAISKMYSWAERVQLRILDVSVPYNILFRGRENQLITVKGEIPVIGINRGNKAEILKLDFGDKHTSQVRTDMNLKFTLQSLAYRKQTGRDIGIHVRNLKYEENIFSFRTEEDYKRLNRTIADISYSIEKELFYPREGLGCVTCNVAGACRVWH